MKKFLSMIFAAAICLTLFAGCKNTATDNGGAQTNASERTAETTQAQLFDDVEYIPGARTDTEYVNELLGFRFECGDKYTMATDDELDKLMNTGVDILYEDTDDGKKIIDYAKITTLYEMSAINMSDSTSVLVMAEKLQLKNMTEGQFISALKTQLENTKLEMEYDDVVDTELCGVTYKNLTYQATAETGSYKQTMLMKKVGDRMVTICFTYLDDEKLDSMFSDFIQRSGIKASYLTLSK